MNGRSGGAVSEGAGRGDVTTPGFLEWMNGGRAPERALRPLSKPQDDGDYATGERDANT